MRYPVNWIAIVRGFNLNKNSKNYHRGVDFGWYSIPHKYQPIYAVADGEVIYKEVQKNSGGLVIHIKHKGCVSEYGHLDTWNVKLGQKVRLTGQVSSYLGDAQIALSNESYDLEIIDDGEYS